MSNSRFDRWFFPEGEKLIIRRKTVLVHLEICITLFAMMCTLHSDIFIENNFFESLSLSFFKMESINKMNISDIIGRVDETNITENDKNNHDYLYIFAIDISGSYLKKSLPGNTKYYYDKKIEEVKTKEKFEELRVIVNSVRNPTILDYVKLRLYELLLDFKENMKNYPNRYFAIWTFGDNPEIKFPDPNVEKSKSKSAFKIPVTEGEIKKAIYEVSILDIKEGEKNTDFIKLIEELKKNYKNEIEDDNSDGEYSAPSVIITFLTDTMHDVDLKIMRRNAIEKYIEGKIDDNWDKLESQMVEFGSHKIMVNLIINSNKDKVNQRSIYPCLRESVEWYCLKQKLITDRNLNYLLYPTNFVPEIIKFYHKHPFHIMNSRVDLIFDKDYQDINVHISEEPGGVEFPRIRIKCITNKKNAKDEDVKENSNNLIQDVNWYRLKECKKGSGLILSYSGRIPSKLSRHIMNLLFEKGQRQFLIPIEFVKVLPTISLVIFYVIIVIFFILVFYVLFLCKKIYSNASSKESKKILEEVQCRVITISGVRCQRKTKDPSEYCWQHKKRIREDNGF